MKNVVFAIGSLYGGGAERVVSVWASALAEKGYQVSVLLYARCENEYPIDDRVMICPIAAKQQECNAMSIVERLKHFRSALKKLRPDVLISFLPEMQVYMAFASIGLGISRVETIRNNPWKVSVVGTKFEPVWRYCFRSCRAVIVQTEEQKLFFGQAIQRKATVIPNPINSRYVESPKTEYNAASHRIVAAGRLTAQKNYKMMINAVKLVVEEYDDVSLQIYGSGEQEELLDAYIKEQGLSDHIKLMGRSNELHRVYQEADLYMMSSDYEGMPNALAEAMAVGLPCISTDCKTGPRDLIDDGENGYLVPCGDAEALAEKIMQVFSMTSEEQRLLGQKARNKIVAFCGEENSVKKIMALIERL